MQLKKYIGFSPHALRAYRSLVPGSQAVPWGQKYVESSPKAEDPIRFSARVPRGSEKC